MSDIKFNCPHCQQRLAIPDVALGRTIPCPICKGHIGLPAKRTPSTQSGASQTASTTTQAAVQTAAAPQTASTTTQAAVQTASAPQTASTTTQTAVQAAAAPQTVAAPQTANTPTQAAAQTATTPQTATPTVDMTPATRTATPQPQQNVDIKFACPTCAVHIVITERAAGKEITCQRCGSRVLVPPVGTPASAAASQPPPPPAVPSNATIPELIEKLRNGDEQVGKLLLQKGEAIIPLLIEGFNEHAITEPDTNRGADHIVKLLARCGAVCVQPLIARLGKSRHAYYALGKIANEDAINALARELTSVNWHRVEIACKALGLVENPNVQKIVSNIEIVRKSTRVGEVFTAASAAIAAIQARFPKAPVSGTTLQPAKVVHGATPLKAPTVKTPALTSHQKAGAPFTAHQKIASLG